MAFQPGNLFEENIEVLFVPAPQIVPQLYQSVPGDIRRPVNGPSRSIPRLRNSVRIQTQRLPCERVTVKVIVEGIFGRALRDNLERIVETEAENFLFQGAYRASQPFGSSCAPIHFLPLSSPLACYRPKPAPGAAKDAYCAFMNRLCQ